MEPETVFEWDSNKDWENRAKHGFSFMEAREVFKDPDAVFLEDVSHSDEEKRYYAVGKIERGIVLTVRYTVQARRIRIFGAAHWRKWRKFYEKRKSAKST